MKPIQTDTGPGLLAVKVRAVATAQAACVVAPFLSDLGQRGVHSQSLGNGLWELTVWLEQEHFHARRLKRVKHLCACLSKSLGEVFLDWELQKLGRLPAKAPRRFFGTFQVTPKLWVAPPGTNLELQEPQRLLELEVGQAENCGLEPASRSALLLLEELLSRERIQRALDVKCGTGIFSMAAVLGGVKRVLALDVDPHAVRVARKNLRKNQLEQAVEIKCVPLKRWGGLYDLVIAVASNKLLLKQLPHILNRVDREGWLLVGGLWHRHVGGFLSRCCPPFCLAARKKELWWESVLLKRENAP